MDPWESWDVLVFKGLWFIFHSEQAKQELSNNKYNNNYFYYYYNDNNNHKS